jgi:hypothetical protein
MTITRIGQLTAELQYTGAFQTDGTNAPTISSTKANTGTYSYRLDSSDDPSGLGFAERTYMRASGWFNHNGLFNSSSKGILFLLYPSGASISGAHYLIWVQSTNTLELYIAGSLVASVSAATVGFGSTDTWYHLGLTFKAHASSGYISVYLNGTLILTYTGNTGTAGIVACYFGGRNSSIGGAGSAWSNYLYVDDFYIDDTSGEADSAPSGRRFLYSAVNGAGQNAQFTPVGSGSNYQNVDDATPDGDTTYNRAQSSGLRDTFTTANITLPANHVIRAAIPVAIVRKTDAGLASQLKLHSYDGSSYQHGSAQGVATTYGIVFERQSLKPNGAAWNETDFNAMQFGYESAGAF